MPQSRREIQADLERSGASPLKQFGQNFMVDPNVVRAIVRDAALDQRMLVIEVGPGTGTLTGELLAGGREVLAVEIDRKLASLLRERFGGEPRFRLIEGDALDGKQGLNPELQRAVAEAVLSGREAAMVANLPYAVASPLIVLLLMQGVGSLTFTVQREVAERLAACPGTPQYGALSVMVQLLGRVRVLRILPPEVFWPRPAVESAVVRVDREDRTGGRPARVAEIVRRIFAFRRKTLRAAIDKAGLGDAAGLEILGIDPGRRAETLSPIEFLNLALSLDAGSPVDRPED
jgi:16S rRNA (adenine1518-N6/adenine1519-N6)-dimethyltransferase